MSETFRALRRRLFLDMVEVLDRGMNEPIYADSLTEEWVNKAIRDELVDVNRKVADQLELLKKAGAAVSLANAVRRQIQEQLASPPPPWKTYGFHADQHIDVVFWGDDGSGLPLWERPVMDRDKIAQGIADSRRREDGNTEYIGNAPIGRDYRVADAVIKYMNEGDE